MLARRQLRSKRLRWPVIGFWRQRHSTTPVLMLKIVANDLRKASSVNAIALQSLSLFLRIGGAQLREEQAMVSKFQDTALGMQAQVDEFVEQYAESTKRVIDRECSDVKKHERDLVENAEALAWHEESVVTELRRELQQARLQVSRGSGLAEQQQRQPESAPVEPLTECLGTLRMKAASDPFRVSSLAFGSSMPAAPEQTHGVCGPGTPAADVGVGAARWAIPAPRDVNIADEDSSGESIGEETDRRRAVVKPIDLGRPPPAQDSSAGLRSSM